MKNQHSVLHMDIPLSLQSLFDESNIQVDSVNVEGIGKVFFTWEQEATREHYAYSGIRVLSPMDDEAAIVNAKRLSLTASSWKNWLINHAVKDRAIKELPTDTKSRLPESVKNATSREIYGGRAIIIPENAEMEAILKNPGHPRFLEVSAPVYAAIGDFLDKKEGKLKVTPDFGPNASTADILKGHTDHVLGISTKGGSGGKSEYSIISILTCLKKMGIEKAPKDAPITVIGSAGALGSGVVDYLKEQGFTNVMLCDLAYDGNDAPPYNATKEKYGYPGSWQITPSEDKKFTDACLGRSGSGRWIITTAYGDEMKQSNWHLMQRGTRWIGAQNKDLPEGAEGIMFARRLKVRGIRHIPGQLLTIGGTTASWVEYHTREEDREFDRDAAYAVVGKVTETIVGHMLEQERKAGQESSPYEAMLDYASKKHWQGVTTRPQKTMGFTYAEVVSRQQRSMGKTR